MQTPVLTQKQQKNALSGRKVKVKSTVKNVLASPFDISFWPLIDLEESWDLKKFLLEELPELRPEDKVVIPYKKIRGVAKAERKAFRASLNPKLRVGNEVSFVVFGVNEVTKALEKNRLSAVLIAHDVQPRFMVQHLLEMSLNLKIPILVVPKLREIIREKSRITGVCLGLLKSHEGSSQVLNEVKKLYSNLAVPVLEDSPAKSDYKSLVVKRLQGNQNRAKRLKLNV